MIAAHRKAHRMGMGYDDGDVMMMMMNVEHEEVISIGAIDAFNWFL